MGRRVPSDTRRPSVFLMETRRTEPERAEQDLRASLHTLGCRLNQYETQLLRDQLRAAGYRIVPFGESADLGVINTCTVTRQADAKCRAEIRRFIRKNPEALTVVIGCYSQMGTDAIAGIPGVDLIIGNHDKLNFMDYLPPEKPEVPILVRDRIDSSDFSISFVGDRPFPYRANLKVQDGCDFVCAFCIIPRARGRARSRDFGNLMAEARQLVGRGVRELILTGVNIGTYDNSGRTFLDLVDALDAIPGLDRIRISSIEPTTVTEAIFPRMADPGHAVLPYLHLPLQSGSDGVLADMRRRYTLDEYLAFVDAAVAAVPDLCVGTDILVGYPTESEAGFEESCRTFLEGPFHYCHVFSFSERPGTRAARYPAGDQVPVPERRRRSAHLRALSAKKRHEFYSRYQGRRMEVLFEDPSESVWSGYTENYIRVVVKTAPTSLRNELARVELVAVRPDFVEGRFVETTSTVRAAG